MLIYSLSPKRLLGQEESDDLTIFLEHILIRRHPKACREHRRADLAILSNPYASNYVQNMVCTTAGFYSAIDPKSAIWNKGLNVTQIPALRYTPTQMDALTFAKVNVLRYKGANTAPVLLHDRTAAIYNSDFTFLLRMNIHDLVIDTIAARADLYEGQSTLDGLQMTSMQSALDEDMVTLTKRGYISKSNITISATQAQQNMGLGAAAGYTRCSSSCGQANASRAGTAPAGARVCCRNKRKSPSLAIGRWLLR